MLFLTGSGIVRDAAAADIVRGAGFLGSKSGQTAFFPPDVMGAVGPDHVVELINGRFAVYDKPTGELVDSRSLGAFWSAAGITPERYAFDPRLLYDPSVGRWWAVAVDNHQGPNDVLVAVSESFDPTGNWTAARIPSDPNEPGQWADFPTLGLSGDTLFVSANMDHEGGNLFDSTTLLAIPKADMLQPVPDVSGITRWENLAAYGTSLQVAVSVGALPEDIPTGLIATRGSFFEGAYAAAISGPATAPVLGEPVFVDLGPGRSAGDAPQPAVGGDPKKPIDTRDNRFSASAVQQGDKLWAVQAIELEGRGALRWAKIDVTTGQLLRTGVMADAQLHYYYPSIAVGELGHVVIGFNGSSEQQPVSSYVAVGRSTGTDTVFQTPTLLFEGTDDYEQLDAAGRNRWGDYSTTVVDPSDPYFFWTFQQVVDGDDHWAIRIDQIRVGNFGDLNSDLVVDRADAAILLAHLGTSAGANYLMGDIDGDGTVSLRDLAMLQSELTEPAPAPSESCCSPGQAPINLVPEPSGWILFALFLGILLAREPRLRRSGESVDGIVQRSIASSIAALPGGADSRSELTL